jgi:hypothetical protein
VPYLAKAKFDLKKTFHTNDAYSPELNPVKMLWSKVKQFLMFWVARDYEDLHKAILAAFDKVSLDDLMNWFIEADLCDSLF